MPLSRRRRAQRDALALRTPQARVLRALMPANPTDLPHRWPTLTRAQLGVRAGYTAISGTITRALNGIREGSSSGDAHPGLLARGMIREERFDIDGLVEVNYTITTLGIQAYQAYITEHGDLPPLKDASSCTNYRYIKTTS